MPQSMKKLLYAGFFIIVFALTVWSVFNGADLEKMLTYLKSTDPSFIIPSIVCVISFILGESVIFFYLFRTLGIHSQFSHCCLYSFIGFFYSCITPSASGGQPMQLIAMRKDLLPVAPCTVVMAIVAITYKMVLVLLGALILITRSRPSSTSWADGSGTAETPRASSAFPDTVCKRPMYVLPSLTASNHAIVTNG